VTGGAKSATRRIVSDDTDEAAPEIPLSGSGMPPGSVWVKFSYGGGADRRGGHAV